MRTYALDLTAKLLDGLWAEVKRASASGDAAAVHDLRVAIRRLSRCLRVFAQFYRRGSWQKVRRRLSSMLHLAGAVRDRDIALMMLFEAGVSRRASVVLQMEKERRQAERRLLAEIRRWRRRAVPARWRRQLIGHA